MERKLTAILAADVAGYSRLMGTDEEGTLDALRAHREVVDGLVVAHRGRVFSSAGDSVVAEFPSAVEAINCAVEIQQEMDERNEAVAEDKRLQFRIGLNIGDVMAEGGNLFGDGVNMAARVQELAEPGGICVARNVYNQVKHKVGVAFESLGPHHVKNITEPVVVYRVLADGLAARPRVLMLLRQARQRVVRFGALAVVLLIAGGALAWRFYFQEPAGLPLPDKPSIAVLPFDNLTDDPQWDRLAGGITEDVITDLSMFRDLFVMARNSTEVYKDIAVDPRQVGRELGVQYVLEGSIQATDKTVRITAQLIDAATGRHVWSERYDGPLEDIFAVQSAVSKEVATRLANWEGVVAGAERARVHRAPPASLQAFDYFLLGMEQKSRFNRDDNIKAQELFRKATELDPRLARAYVGLAWTYCLEVDFAYASSPAQSVAECLEFAKTAVALDPGDADAHTVLSTAYTYVSDFARAETEIEHALALNPNSAETLMIYAYNGAWMFGKPELGRERGEQALRLNPTNYPTWYNQALRTAYYFAGDFEKSLVAAQRVAFPVASDFALLAAVNAQLGRDDEARTAAASVRQADPDWSAEEFLNDYGKFRRDTEMNLYFDGLRKAGVPICASDSLLAARPDLKRLAVCEQERAKS
jgi:TolB-like protein/class 3 adenylate cyclase